MTSVEYRHIGFKSAISEDALQQQIVRWFDIVFPEAERKRLHHSPNGGSRNQLEAIKFKRMGVRAGFPDLWLSLGDGRTGYIELKVGKNDLTEHQKEYRDLLLRDGNKWALCRSLDEFITTLREWGIYKGGKNEGNNTMAMG